MGEAVRIKMCGLTSLDDALAAVDSGATYLGFNFYAKSPRRIEPDACARITAELARRGSSVKTVGVFVNHSPMEVAALMEQCSLDLAQLHGDEQLQHLPALRGRAFKAVHGEIPADAVLQDLARFGPGQPAFLLDAHAPGQYGGTGQLADWDAAAVLAERYPIFLAGGLTPDNVAAAIAQVKPWGVDVASGVEAAPGKKDAAKMRAFAKNVFEANKGFEGHKAYKGEEPAD